VSEANKFYIEDRGQRRGLYINGEKTESRELQDGDVITFGLEDSYEIIYRSSDSAGDESIPLFLTRIEHMTSAEKSSGGLKQAEPAAGSDDAAATRSFRSIRCWRRCWTTRFR